MIYIWLHFKILIKLNWLKVLFILFLFQINAICDDKLVLNDKTQNPEKIKWI